MKNRHHYNKSQAGFGVVEIFLIILVVVLVGGASWYFLQRSKSASGQSDNSSANSAPPKLSQTEIVSSLASELPQKFSYIQSPKTNTFPLHTNLPSGKKWWVMIPKNYVSLVVATSTATPAMRAEADPARQAGLTADMNAVGQAAGKKLTGSGYVLAESLNRLPGGTTGGILSSEPEPSAKLYHSSGGDCLVSSIKGIPPVVQLSCASTSAINEAYQAVKPYADLFVSAHQSQDPTSYELTTPVSLKGASHDLVDLGVEAPNGNDIGPIYGSYFFINDNGTWKYLIGPEGCSDQNGFTVTSQALTRLGIQDSGAATAIHTQCNAGE